MIVLFVVLKISLWYDKPKLIALLSICADSAHFAQESISNFTGKLINRDFWAGSKEDTL